MVEVHAGPVLQGWSAAGCGVGASSAHLTLDCLMVSVLRLKRVSRCCRRLGSSWPSAVKDIISWGGPRGRSCPRSTCQKCLMERQCNRAISLQSLQHSASNRFCNDLGTALCIADMLLFLCRGQWSDVDVAACLLDPARHGIFPLMWTT